MAREIKERLKKAALAVRLEISRPTLDKYLGMVGAPAPDAAKAYCVEDVLAWLGEHGTKVGEDPQTMQQWKIREVQLRCQKMTDEIERRRDG